MTEGDVKTVSVSFAAPMFDRIEIEAAKEFRDVKHYIEHLVWKRMADIEERRLQQK